MMKCVWLCALAALQSVVFAEDSVEEYGRKNGGWQRFSGKGFVAVLDCRGGEPGLEYAEGIAKVKEAFKTDMKVLSGKPFSLANAVGQLESCGGNAAVFIVDDPALPMTLTAYEDKWTLINAAKAAADSPEQKRLCKRLSILFMRQCCRIIGSDASKSPETCQYHVFSLKDLDAIDTYDVGFGTSLCVNESMCRLGLEPVEMITYREACEMGKAAAPTNAIQKAIWEQVYTPPKNPMKIEFDPKKGK